MSTLAKHVTVVDDDHDVLAVTKIMLERNGYTVHDFTDPEDALVHAEDCKDCGILITDVRMPNMNGFQLVRALKKLRPDIKVVIMTAFEINSKEWQKILPSTKVNEFLIKPFNEVKLVAAIENYMPLLTKS